MSTDPFDEPAHDRSANFERPRPIPSPVARRTPPADVFSPLPASPATGSSARKAFKSSGESDPHADTTRASPALAVMHRRGFSTDALSSADNSLQVMSALPSDARHNRTRSTEVFDNHMLGSIYAPNEVCMQCQQPRSSSVYCSVSKLHHGTDAPMPEETARADTADDAKEAAAAAEPVAAPEKKKSWHFFKTPEEKANIALQDEEEAARKKLAKSKTNPDGEHFARTIIRGAFADGLSILLQKEKSAALTEKLEHEKRVQRCMKEEVAFRDILKEEAKKRKGILKKNPDAIRAPASPTAAAAGDEDATKRDTAAASPAETADSAPLTATESGVDPTSLVGPATPSADDVAAAATTTVVVSPPDGAAA